VFAKFIIIKVVHHVVISGVTKPFYVSK